MSISSIDKAEVAKFSNLADKWWDKSGEFKMLHEINPARLSYIEEKINEHYVSLTLEERKNLAIIDVGCGGGILSSALATVGYINVSGIDASSENIAIAIKSNKQNLQVNYFCSSVEQIEAENKQYDIVICLEVVEHVTNVQHFLSSLSSLVKSDGILLISTINRNVKSYLQAIIAAEYILGWVPKNTHDHNKFLQPWELSNMMPASMILKELKGLVYDLSSNSWKLNDDISVNYFAFFAKL